MVNEIFDVTLDAVLLTIFTIVLYYFPKRDSVEPSTNQGLTRTLVYKENYHSVFLKYSCLAAMCLSGILVPSFACFVYYILFTVVTTVIVLFKLSYKTIACLFRTICFYTCFHIFMLFTYQIEWIQNLKSDMNLKWVKLKLFIYCVESLLVTQK